jgi:ADP-ribose pyrophosphatase YjhB (NUDIX family)
MSGTRRLLVPLITVALTLGLGACGFGGDDNGGGENGDTTATAPLPAATLTLLRQRGNGLEVLLVRRNPNTTFGVDAGWGFPGGSVNSGSGGEAGRRAAAAKLTELTGIAVNPDELVAYSRWITPSVPLFPSGVDTRFYLARGPAHSRPRPDRSQIVDAGWFEPQRALAGQYADLPLDYATTQHLKSLAGFATAADAIESARSREVKSVELRVVGKGDQQRVVLPDKSLRPTPGSK